MKIKDIIRGYGGKSLYIHFAATGEMRKISIVELKGISFSLRGKSIEATTYGNDNATLIDSFSSDTLASAAYHFLESTASKQFRRARLSHWIRGCIKWGVYPVLLVFVALAANVAITHGSNIQPGNAATLQSPVTVVPLPSVPSLPVTANANGVYTSPSEMARAMRTGVATGSYTIPFANGDGDKGTLYVFSDPFCSHCQDMDRELDALAEKGHAIHIFPVSVIGGQKSLEVAAQILCAPAKDRTMLWKRALSGESDIADRCQTGMTAAQANNKFFRTVDFPGTPIVLNGQGDRPPSHVDNTALDLHNWLIQ